MDVNTTAKLLLRDSVPFYLVVEPQEADIYAARFGRDRLLVLPANDQGLVYVRNWIKGHATDAGYERHWQLDDNLTETFRAYRPTGLKLSKRLPCQAGIALRVTEDFVDRYTNVAIAGLNYDFFVSQVNEKPFRLNCHVYSCTLVLNSLPHRWRLRYNDDTDFCLQVLADGWCTVQMQAFLVHKKRTMTVKGGNTPIYQQDGRLEMARSLERTWPGVVKTGRRFKRPQHLVHSSWGKFDTPLQRRTDIDFDNLSADAYGMSLRQAAPEIKSERLKRLVAEDEK